VVDCIGQSSGWTDAVEWGSDYRDANGDGNFDVYGCGEGEWIADADGLGAGIDYGLRTWAVGYNDEPGGCKEWKFVQCVSKRDGWDAELYVVDRIG
jgi:hypothetical protein